MEGTKTSLRVMQLKLMREEELKERKAAFAVFNRNVARAQKLGAKLKARDCLLFSSRSITPTTESSRTREEEIVPQRFLYDKKPSLSVLFVLSTAAGRGGEGGEGAFFWAPPFHDGPTIREVCRMVPLEILQVVVGY